MKSAVFPWTEDLKLTDAFRAPLAEVFPLLEAIQNYQDQNRYFLVLNKAWQTVKNPQVEKSISIRWINIHFFCLSVMYTVV